MSQMALSIQKSLLAVFAGVAAFATQICTVSAQYPPPGGGFSGSSFSRTDITCQDSRLQVKQCTTIPGQLSESCITLDRSPFAIECRKSDFYNFASVAMLSETTCGFRYRGIDMSYQAAYQSLQDRPSVLLLGADVSIALFQDPWDMERRFRNPKLHLYVLRNYNGKIIKSGHLTMEAPVQTFTYNCSEFMSAGQVAINQAVNELNQTLGKYNATLEQFCNQEGGVGLTFCR